jgi:flagellar biosynthesis protein FlhG
MASTPVVCSITSGKGGVGKTNIAVNLAVLLARMEKRCILLDADLGLANVDVLLGLTPEHNLGHLFQGMEISQILFPSGHGFSILPATSGGTELLTLSTGQKLELLESMDSLEDQVDILLVDTGAGVGDTVLYFNVAAQERILVLTPEPTSLTDAYALIKVLKTRHGVERFHVLVNMATAEREAKGVFARLHGACDHFLGGISLNFLGTIPHDISVRHAVTAQVPFCVHNPESPASKAMGRIAQALAAWKAQEHLDGNIKFFWKKLLFASS